MVDFKLQLFNNNHDFNMLKFVILFISDMSPPSSGDEYPVNQTEKAEKNLT